MPSGDPTTEKSTPWVMIIAGVVVVAAMAAIFLLPALLPGVDTSETRASIQTVAFLGIGAIFAHQLKQAAEAAERQKKIEEKIDNADRKIETLSVNVDGRLSQLLELTAASSLAEGKLDTTDANRRVLTASDKADAREEGRAFGDAAGEARGIRRERQDERDRTAPTLTTPTVTTSTGEQGHLVDEEVLVKITQKEG